jgi:hypothetical protein
MVFVCQGCALSAETLAGPHIGTRLSYEVHYQSKGYSDLSAAIGTSDIGGGRPARHDLLGTLEAVEVITVLDHRRPGGIKASATFERVVVGIQVDGRPQSDKEREVAADLTKTIYFYLDANGRLDQTDFPKQYTSMARNFARAILLTQQFVLPANHQLRQTWLTHETGASTPYSARYQTITNSGTVARVSKTMGSDSNASVPSTRAGTAEAGIAARTVPQGKIEFRLNSMGTIERLQGTFHEDIFIQSRQIAAQDTSLLAQLLSDKPLSQGELAAARRTFSMEGSTASASPVEDPEKSEGETSVQRQILGQDSAESIQHDLSLLDGQGVSRDQQTKIYLKLKALFYLRPEETAVLGKTLSTGDLEKPSAEMLGTALASVGSSAAQRALCGAIQARKVDSRSLTTLVPLLGSIDRPTKQVSALLEELTHSSSREVQSVALLGLGAVARKLSKQSPTGSNTIVSELVDRLSVAASDDKATVLLALGNTGSNRAMTVIVAQRADRSPGIRRAVAAALSGFQATVSDQTLCEMLKTDQDSQVRAAAAQALTTRNGVVIIKKTLLAATQQDKAENVRIASLFALTDRIPTDEAIQRIIATVARTDNSEVVRKQARSLLEQGTARK